MCHSYSLYIKTRKCTHWSTPLIHTDSWYHYLLDVLSVMLAGLSSWSVSYLSHYYVKSGHNFLFIISYLLPNLLLACYNYENQNGFSYFFYFPYFLKLNSGVILITLFPLSSVFCAGTFAPSGLKCAFLMSRVDLWLWLTSSFLGSILL